METHETDLVEARLQALILIAEENYAHARDHENLRAQVTATLVAASFVLIGLTLDKELTGLRLTYVGLFSVLIGVLNVVLVLIHNNRFERHVSIARDARRKIYNVEAVTTIPKFLSLSRAWLTVASLPAWAGAALVIVQTIR